MTSGQDMSGYLAQLLFNGIPVDLEEDNIPAYQSKVLALESPTWEALYPCNETVAGGTGDQMTDVSSNERHGTYDGVTIADELGPDGESMAAFWDGVNDVGVCPAALIAAMSLDVGAFAGWFKMASGVWTDSTYRTPVNIFANATKEIQILRTTNNGQIRFIRKHDGGATNITRESQSVLDWVPFVFSWDRPGDALVLWYDRVKYTTSGLVVATGTISEIVLGDRTSGKTSPHHGHLAWIGFSSTVISDEDAEAWSTI